MKLLSKKNIIYLVGILYCGSFYPAFWTAVLVGRITMLYHVFFLILWTVVVGRYCSWKFCRLNTIFNKLYLLICIFYIFRLVLFTDFENIYQIVRMLIFYFDIYVTNTLLTKDADVLKKFMWCHVYMLAFTIIGMVLFIMGKLNPIGTIEISPLGEERLLNFGLFFVKIHGGSTDLVDTFARPSGYYDEPGSLGLMIILLLLFNKNKLKDKRLEFLLLVGGFVSMSMAYIVASLVYVVLFMVNKKYIPYVSIGVLVFVFAINIYQEGESEFGDFFYSKTIGRAKKISDGEDQSRDFNASYGAFVDNWLIGESTNILDKKYPNATHETIWFFLAQYGIIGSIFLFSPFWLILFRRGNIDEKKSLLVLLVIIYQRPHYLEPLYLIMLYSIFYADYKITTSINRKSQIKEIQC